MKPNQTRANRCEQLLAQYADDDQQTNLIDLLADARHWCDAQGESYAEFDRRSYEHYLAEIHPVSGDEQ